MCKSPFGGIVTESLARLIACQYVLVECEGSSLGDKMNRTGRLVEMGQVGQIIASF